VKNLIIDRFEGGFAICEDENGEFFGIDIKEVPQSAKEGSVLTINQEGQLTLNEEETKKRTQSIKGKMDKLKNKSRK
jgi:hypothetical protein